MQEKNETMNTNQELKEETGFYLYCIAEQKDKYKDEQKQNTNFGKIGIEENEVFTIPCGDLCAVVHRCQAKPYVSDNEEIVKNWVATHQNVIETASKKFGTVIPFSFDVIIKGDKENVLSWLKNESENLKKKIERVRGKQEFGIQIFWKPDKIQQELWAKKQILQIKKEMEGKPPGIGYFYKEKLKKALKTETEKIAGEHFKNFYSRIKSHASNVKVEKIKKISSDEEMLMNLSCLVDEDRVKELGTELEKIAKLDSFSVRFTGPWSPYSFVD